MHLITGVLSIIGVAIVGFIGHVLAYDFCERAPALARWLLAIAAERLPLANRARYAEEWAAHLVDCNGVCAKLRHAFGCLWCARRVRRQTFKAMTLSVSFILPTIGQAIVETNLYEVGVLLWLFQFFARTKPTKHGYIGVLTLLFWLRVFVDARGRSGLTGSKFANFICVAKSEDWVPTAIILTIEGESIELIAVLRSLGNSLKAFLAKIAQTLNTEVEPQQVTRKIDGPAINRRNS
jgi:hypothetical protein